MGWNDVGSSSGSFLKLEPGQKVKLHILSDEPQSSHGIFNQAIQRGARVPEGFSVPGVDVRVKHAFIVWNIDAKSVQVWEVSDTTGTAIKNIYEQYGGSLAEVDLMVTRMGSGLKTKYPLVPIPTKFDAACIEGVELPDLEVLMKPDDEETIQNILGGAVPDGDGTNVKTNGDFPIEPPSDELEKPVAPAKSQAPVNNAAEKIGLIKQAMAIFAAKPKYKDQKVRLAVIRVINKTKTLMTQLTVDEIKKLLVILKK